MNKLILFFLLLGGVVYYAAKADQTQKKDEHKFNYDFVSKVSL